MATKSTFKPVVAAVSMAFVAGLATVPTVNAAENPFAATELSSGYAQVQLADNHKQGEGKCGEAKCGGDKAEKKAEKEGKCGGDKSEGKADKEGKCGGDKKVEKKADREGKCGEAKCGGNKG